MLETYLADIEQLAHSEQRPAALRTALGLPHIAAALSDASLQSSAQRFRDWCAAWLSTSPEYELTRSIDGQRLFEEWRSQAGAHGSDFDGSASAVPQEALRQLRLRRLARAAPVSAAWVRPEDSAPEAAREFELCLRLIEGVRRWYARQGIRDEIVQRNLARLAVLR